MKWDWIFFDADETLFTFDSFSGLQRMFLDYSVTFTAEDFQDYQAVNKPLWVDYQNGAITSLQLQHQRFDSWAERSIGMRIVYIIIILMSFIVGIKELYRCRR